MIPAPTKEDIARNLAADLAWLDKERPRVGEGLLFVMTYAAIRRAAAAEARVKELEAELEELRRSNCGYCGFKIGYSVSEKSCTWKNYAELEALASSQTKSIDQANAVIAGLTGLNAELAKQVELSNSNREYQSKALDGLLRENQELRAKI